MDGCFRSIHITLYIYQSKLIDINIILHPWALLYIKLLSLFNSLLWIQLSLALCSPFILSFTIGRNLTQKSSQVSEEKRKERTKKNHPFQNCASGLSCSPAQKHTGRTMNHNAPDHLTLGTLVWQPRACLLVRPISVSSCMERDVCV